MKSTETITDLGLENCEAGYTVTFNETVMNMSYYDIVGTYAYVDIDSNGTKFYRKHNCDSELHVTVLDLRYKCK